MGEGGLNLDGIKSITRRIGFHRDTRYKRDTLVTQIDIIATGLNDYNAV